MIEEIIQGLILVLGSAWAGNFILGLFQRKKIKAAANLDEAHATQVITGTATSLLQPLTNRIKDLETETTTLRAKLRDTSEEVNKLNRLLHKANAQLEAATAENKRVTEENRHLRLRLRNGTTS